MARTSAPRPISELAAHVGGELVGDPSTPIVGVNGLAEAGPGELSFFGSARYRAQFAATRASAVLVGPSVAPSSLPGGVVLVRVDNPHLAFARISALFHPRRAFAPGTSPGAQVHPEARVAQSATVMAGATVERGATVGERSVLFPGVFLGEGASVGPDCLLYPNVTVREGCQLGARVVLHPSCVVGADGFGFAFDAGAPGGPEHFKIPQTGIVRIEDDVEVGACSCIDRATHGETVIGKGTKIDNLVQIAHNVKVGPLSILCAQAGVSGSAELGTGVLLAGQVGVVGHIRVGDLAKVGAQAGVAQAVPDGAVVSGTPATAHKSWLKNAIAFERLSELVKEVRQLRRKVEALEGKR
ncbi:MAG: UDP-3-O-(3-hydroxymyristoyl)glucosamine N-acyltransferase [Myxococcaceae bacterium]